MKTLHYALAAIALFVVLLAAACSAPAPTQQANNPPPAPTLAPPPTAIQPAATAVPPVQPSGGGAVVQAPICQASGSCSAVTAEQINLDCVKKVPYVNVLVPPGTKFEVLDKSGEFVCNDSGMVVNGKEVLSCRGKVLYSFQLKLTNAACDSSALQTGTGQCQEGYGFDAAQNCCAPVSAGSGGSTTVTVNLPACPTPMPSNP